MLDGIQVKDVYDVFRTYQIHQRLIQITDKKKLIIHPWKIVEVLEEKVDTQIRSYLSK